MRSPLSLEVALLALLTVAGLPRQPRPRSPGARPSFTRRAGRNARCPCGSGIKFKRCCGR